MIDIYISTMAFKNCGVEEIIAIAKEKKMSLEFSSGLPYHPDMEQVYINAPVKRLPHNYFPAPADPFVLNLASNNEKTRKLSVLHCIKGLQLAKKSGAPFFSAHAGFCIDPKPSELGKEFTISAAFDKEEHWKLFINSICEILDHAEANNMGFLVENNVIASFNMVEGVNPLFCCEGNEISRLFRDVNNDKLGLLLDTGHLKVSCNTLGLYKNTELEKIAPFIKCIHHSDNDSIKDSNQPLEPGYWFLNEMIRFQHIPHVLETRNASATEIETQINILKKACL
jgi:sugar phosphate isomerase/epimerase